MSEETKIIIDFVQSNQAETRQIMMVILGIIGTIISSIAGFIFISHRKLSTSLNDHLEKTSLTEKKVEVMANDIEHIKNSIEEIKNNEK